ncbi:hypothetical protein QDQ55_23635 [Enterobacter hormaechei]|uniref:hypothetical protein n=1 Tax=Enterobacter cloacae complex TaxID=354276 RepID=UPI00244B4A32|nr:MULTISPECIES: hypothetical protein [Enterobacter cloacae complex]MDG9952676.1 hypothetical protein [Enterobacter roggenkampii]MDR9940078.1 hypothetical protein [Enterobacter hormaechei subsp. xiangfangensis]
MNVRKAIAEMKRQIESAQPVEAVPVIFPGDDEPTSGQFIRLRVIDASAGNGGSDTPHNGDSDNEH